MAWAAWAVPLIASVISGLLSKQGASKQAKTQKMGLKFQERARRQAMQQLEAPNIWSGAQWLFPGLLPGPTSTGGVRGPGAFNVSGPVSAPPRVLTPGAGPVQFRQGGGPVRAGQPYVVGESGPETIVPYQSGNVLPAPAEPAVGQQTQQVLTGDYIPPGAPPGTTTVTPSNPSYYPGDLYTAWMNAFMSDPGQVSPIQYERAQEQANQGLNAGQYAISGGMSGQGVDPNSGMGQMLSLANVNANQLARNEAARNLALIQESLWRQDVGQGAAMYDKALQTSLGLAGQRSAAAGGTSYQGIQNPVDPYGNLGAGIGAMGYFLGNYFGNRYGSSGGFNPYTQLGGGYSTSAGGVVQQPPVYPGG